MARVALSRICHSTTSNVDIDAAGLFQILLKELVHRQRQHLSRARGRDHHLEGERFFRREAGFREQLLALGGIERVAVLTGVPKFGIARLEPADGRLRRAVEKCHEAVAVDAIVQRLAYAHVLERARCRADVVEPGPIMRIGAGRDVEAGRFQRSNSVRRRHFDPVDLAGAQRCEPRIGFGDRHQHDMIELRLLARIPVSIPAVEIDFLARNDLADAEAARCRQRAMSRPCSSRDRLSRMKPAT